MSVWAHAYGKGAEKVTVFEDDIASYITDLDRKVAAAPAMMDPDWDILYLGKCIDRCDLYEPVSEGLYRTFSPLCTHAYIISCRGIRKFFTKALYTGIDTQLRDEIERGAMKAYAFHPSIFIQDIVRWSSTLRNFKLQVGNQIDCAYVDR